MRTRGPAIDGARPLDASAMAHRARNPGGGASEGMHHNKRARKSGLVERFGTWIRSADRARGDAGDGFRGTGPEGELLEDAIERLFEKAEPEALCHFVSALPHAQVSDRYLELALNRVSRHASDRGLTEVIRAVARLKQSRAEKSSAYARLMSTTFAALAASGDRAEVLDLITGLVASPVHDDFVLGAVDAAAREAGQLRDQDFEAQILKRGFERFRGSHAFAWRASRAAHRSGDYAEARRLIPDDHPPDRRARDMLLDMEALDALPASIVDMTALPRSYDRADASRTAVLYAVFNALPYATGGYATRTHGLMSALGSAGVPLNVIVRPGAVKDLEAPEGGLRHEIDGVPYVYLGGKAPAGRFLRNRRFAEAFETAITHYSPTIMHSASNFENGLSAAAAAATAGVPYVYEVRGFWEITRLSETPEFWNHPLFRRNMCAEIATCLLADRVVTLNESMKELLTDCGVPEEAIDLLPNAAPTDLFSPRPRDAETAAKLGLKKTDTVIGYVGSFLPYEGIELLIEAFGRLAAKHSRLKLLLVGDHEPAGPRRSNYFDLLQKTAAQSAHRDRIIFHPRVPYHEVPDLYSVIDIAPFPRRSMVVTEIVSPMKPREAMAMETAVAVSGVGGLRCLIDPEVTGVLFEPDDVASLSACLERLIAQPDLRRSIAHRARVATQSGGSWDTAAETLRDIYRRANDSRFRDRAAWAEAGRRAAALLRADATSSAVDAVLDAIRRRM